MWYSFQFLTIFLGFPLSCSRDQLWILKLWNFHKIFCLFKTSFSNYFFSHFWLFYAFSMRMTACTLHIKWFHWHQESNGINDLNSLNNLSGLNDLNSLISSKNLYFKVKMYIFDGLLLFITWKRLKKSFWTNLLCPFSLIYLSSCRVRAISKKYKLMN